MERHEASTLDAPKKPQFRGVLHQIAFFVSLIAGGVLVALAPSPPAMLAAAIYAGSLSALLGTSALYHRVTWSVSARRWMGRLDHSMINVLIAGTFTPFALVVLSKDMGGLLLEMVWTGALIGILLHVFWLDAPKWLSAVLYVALGRMGVVAAPQVIERAGWTVAGLVLAGGLLYTAGALVYAMRRPDPAPASFGYHEVFHALVVAASGLHFGAIASVILPAA
jgi:hemolysin III